MFSGNLRASCWVALTWGCRAASSVFFPGFQRFWFCPAQRASWLALGPSTQARAHAQLPNPHPQEPRELILASSSWTLSSPSQALPLWGWGGGLRSTPPAGFAIIESLCLIEESPVLWEIRERAPLRFVTRRRGISARVYTVTGGSFMFDS